MKKSWQIWLGVLALMIFIYATRAILLPFIVGLGVAYLLDPLADRLEARKVPRWLAAASLLVLFFILASAVLVAIFPLLKTQMTAFIQNLPDYIAAARPLFDDLWTQALAALNLESSISSESVIEEASRAALAKVGTVLAGFLSGGMALFNFLTLLLISPVVAFFMLRDWDILLAKVNALLPKKEAPAIRKIGNDIDAALGGFVRGQSLSALVMATFYAIGWSLAGLEYALVLGLIGGVMAYIPFVGALFTLVLALLVGVGQFGMDPGALGLIALVYVAVQLLEGMVLTPRLIGSHVRLHPVWVLFAIFAGGEILGFVGVLIAIPVAAVVGVLVRFFVERYLKSHWHKGGRRKKRRRPRAR